MATHKRANWSGLIVSDRPSDEFGLSATQEDDFENITGLIGKDQANSIKQKGILFYNKTAAPTLTDYANIPLGSIIIAPYLTAPKIYIKKLASSTPAVSDWFSVALTVES